MTAGDKSLFNPSGRMLRQFSAIWIIFFGGIAAVQEFHHHHHVLAMVLGAMAITLGPLGVLWPRLMKPIFVGWMVLVYPIGWVVSRVILGVLFYSLFAPTALVFRFIGRDALSLKPKPQADSFWSPKVAAVDKAHYLRQS
jgi:RsiW-degrading membrane proteinase PrsW (M82 family)